MRDIALNLMVNGTIILGLSYMYGIFRTKQTEINLKNQIITGLIFGIFTVLDMIYPVDFGNGIIIDLRVVTIIASVFAGGLPSITITYIIAAVYRISIGGAGLTAGLVTTFVPAVIATIFYYRWKHINNVKLYQAGLLAFFIAVINTPFGVVLLPESFRPVFLYQITPVVAILYPIVFAGIINIIQRQERYVNAIKETERARLKFYATFNQSYQLIWITDPYGKIIEINESVVETANLQEVTGVYLWDERFWSKSDSEKIRKSIELAAKGYIEKYNTEIIKKNGGTVVLDFSIKPVRDQSGKIFMLIAEGHNITQEKIYDKQIEVLNNITPISNAVVDNTGDIIFSNSEFKSMFGDLTGKKIDDYFYDEYDYKKGSDHNKTIKLKNTSGGFFWAKMWVDRIIYREKDSYVFIFFDMTPDITNRKKLENALKKTKIVNEELEQFAYVASHDLKEPIRMVSSFTQLLEAHYSQNLDEKSKMFINYIKEGSSRMQILIDALLLYSRTGQSYEPVFHNIENGLKIALINLSILISERSAKINIEGQMPELKADEAQIIRLFQNLIGNAVKFNKSDVPEVTIKATEQENNYLFEIVDNGIGIDEEYQEKIFQIFQRLHLKEEYDGAGIGLSLCKRIVNNHGGNIGVKSKVGNGSTFWFTIPK